MAIAVTNPAALGLAAHAELALRVVVATLLGGVIGFERDLRGRAAGLRTHALVALASSVFMVVSTRFVYFQSYGHEDLVAVDSSRIAASVVAGIGFLAGGVIFKSGVNVLGLTTAAGLWLVAAIGLASGGGMYVEALVATAIGLGVLTVLRRFEDLGGKKVRLRVTLVLRDSVSDPSAWIAGLGTVLKHESERDARSRSRTTTLETRSRSDVDLDAEIAKLGELEGLERVKIERLE